MACLGVQPTRGIAFRADRARDRVNKPGKTNWVRVTPRKFLPAVKCSSAVVKVAEGGGGGNGGGAHIRGEPEKLDRWVKESVGEIVKNLKEAPLFVHVYNGPEPKLKTEKAQAQDWAQLKGKWVKGEEPSPEGIILVEELKEGDIGIFEENEGQNGDSTKAWGLLIQGKGEDGGVACYLLKTSKVGCGNLGLFCTHYCLVRVKSFRESVRSQLTSCWLG